MIKQSLKDKIVYVSIDNIDFSYRIPVKKIGNKLNWRIGAKGTDGIVVNDVSTWTMQLFTKVKMDEKYMQEFKKIVQEHAPNNSINWDDTFKAVNIQNEYNILVGANNAAINHTEVEIIAALEKKFDLDY